MSAELRALAEAAKESIDLGLSDAWDDDWEGVQFISPETSDYIGAVCPDVVVGLLDTIALYKEALHWVVADDEELGAAVDAWFAAVRELGA